MTSNPYWSFFWNIIQVKWPQVQRRVHDRYSFLGPGVGVVGCVTARMCVCSFSLIRRAKGVWPWMTRCGVGGIKLFVKRNTFVSCCVCVSQISSDLTYLQQGSRVPFSTVTSVCLDKGLIVGISVRSHLFVWHTWTFSPWVLWVSMVTPVRKRKSLSMTWPLRGEQEGKKRTWTN